MSLEAFSEKFFIFSFSMRKRREKITRAGNPEQSIVSFAISKTLYTFRSSCWSRKFRCNKFPPRSPESQRSHKKGNFVSREVMQTGEWNPPERKISDSLFVKNYERVQNPSLKVPSIIKSTQRWLTLPRITKQSTFCDSLQFRMHLLFSSDFLNRRTFLRISMLRIISSSPFRSLLTERYWMCLRKKQNVLGWQKKSRRRQKVANLMFRNISFWQVAEGRRTKSFYVNRSSRM